MKSNKQSTKQTEALRDPLELVPIAKTSSQVFKARVPGSKSYSNRALILASSWPGATSVVNALKSQDTLLLAKALGQIEGLRVSEYADGFEVERTAETLHAPAAPLYLGGGGTPARFIISFAASLQGRTVVTGNARLSERPMQDLLDALTTMGVPWRCLGKPGCLPVEVEGKRIENSTWTVSGEVSSQFLSSLLLLAAQQRHLSEVAIRITGALVSKPYVEMTLASLKAVGIQCAHQQYTTFTVSPKPVAVRRFVVEPDASAMSYGLVAAAITKTRVRFEGIGKSSAQGDVGVAYALERMGCRLTATGDSIEREGKPLAGIDIDMESMPDTVLTLAIAASQARGWTSITNIGNLRVKECDRIHAISAELSRLGYTVDEGQDRVAIRGGTSAKPAMVHTYDDHRVAMSFALLSLLYSGISIENPRCVEKSFPDFWQELARLRTHHQTEV
jgi:3-phosphoshikimate 1-carboxyvinyltransferase